MPLPRFLTAGYRFRSVQRGRWWWGLLVLGSSLSACRDVFAQETPIYGPYYVSQNPAASFYTLYYRGSGAHQGLDFERFRDVSRVGYCAGYVFLQSGRSFYWFAVGNDQETDAGDPAIRGLISQALTPGQFRHLTDSLRTGPIPFQFSQ